MHFDDEIDEEPLFICALEIPRLYVALVTLLNTKWGRQHPQSGAPRNICSSAWHSRMSLSKKSTKVITPKSMRCLLALTAFGCCRCCSPGDPAQDDFEDAPYSEDEAEPVMSDIEEA